MISYSYRYFRTRPRLMLGILTGIITFFVLPMLAKLCQDFLPFAKAFLTFETVSEVLIAWNIGVWTYLVAVFFMMYHATQKHILDKIKDEDEGTVLMIILVLITAIVSVVAIVAELGISKDAKGWLMGFHVALTFITIITAWLFIHTMFALHYTHKYYLAVRKSKKLAQQTDNTQKENALIEHNQSNTKSTDNDKPLDFPHEDTPNYWDFLYFSYIIGTSAQTADVSFTSQKIRQLGTVHCVLAFFYNVAVMSLMINLASGLIGN